MTDILSSIMQGIIDGFGFQWMGWVVVFIAMFALLAILLELDVATGFVIMSMPLLLVLVYQLVATPSWVIGAIVIVVGFVFGVSVFKLLVR